ncbi:modification methylase [Bajunvirus bajun]|uniref:DNA (cytosine-5-)-methyltransferase n=1 Tax=Brevundimonas phage vB_BgoS-Bajun TaxID=2948594 RepID=A0A9E7N7C2_9CAUD|nr:modification methylase [Brevundimonas phage vB_BgoS-Bajun]
MPDITAPIRFATVCSGVEAVSLAWEPQGFEPIFYSEIEAFPNAVLKHHWPDVPNLGDLTRIDGTVWADKVDVFWASFPCQDFSVAGKQASIMGANGALTLGGLRLVDEIDPKVFCYENVEGLLTDDHNAFGYLLGALCGEFGPLEPPRSGWTDAGYVSGPRRTIAWRLLDAQHFGVPQSRKRVVLVACPRTSGVDPRDILHEGHAEGDSLEQRAQRRANAIGADEEGALALRVAIRGRTINDFSGQQIEVGNDIANCLRTAGGGGSIGLVLTPEGDLRKLSPLECERLQGMPDNHTLIPGASATQRYDAIGNSLAVPMVAWIGARIKEALA